MKKFNTKTILVLLGAIAMGVLIGWMLFGGSKDAGNQQAGQEAQSGQETIWTCSMHPQIRSNEPGDCPICGMELIPLEDAGDQTDPRAVRMSPTAMQLASVQTMVVGSGSASNPAASGSIRLNGKVQADERLRSTQSSHLPGRIEKLMLNFTGEQVKAGQTIAMVYSPELVTAQQELFEAQKIKDTQPGLFNAAKEKLKNWKLTDRQLDQILAAGKPIETFPIQANASGYVTQKMVKLGDYIRQGQAIYEISDLSRVWVLFDVYESDMQWVHKGSKVAYTVPSIPGETFTGTISYLDPVIDPQTRVAQARIEARNPGGKLKPEMFVSGTVESKIQGTSFSIPKTAVMWTGKRSLVYVKNTSEQGIDFLMREITLGPELGEEYVVESGLEPGEEIAVNGTFSIDAAAQLAGKPSMMSPEGSAGMTGHEHGSAPQPDAATISGEAKEALAPLYQAYFELETALAKDDLATAKKSAASMDKALGSINMALFKGNSHDVWMTQTSVLQSNLRPIESKGSLDEVREKFLPISTAMIRLAEALDPLSETVYIQHCPMANSNRGADWLSRNPEIFNPYFGASMLKCGETTKEIK